MLQNIEDWPLLRVDHKTTHKHGRRRTTFERGTATECFAVPYLVKKNLKHIGDLVLLI